MPLVKKKTLRFPSNVSSNQPGCHRHTLKRKRTPRARRTHVVNEKVKTHMPLNEKKIRKNFEFKKVYFKNIKKNIIFFYLFK